MLGEVEVISKVEKKRKGGSRSTVTSGGRKEGSLKKKGS
jgi:hypothetical protein